MISAVTTSVADVLPVAALNADAAEAVETDGAGTFGNVLEQLMGAPPRKSAGVDLPLEDEGQLPDDAAIDELVNANVVDLGAQPINRLVLAPTWALTDTTATSVAVDAAVDSTVAERSVSAPTGMSQLPGVDVPALAADYASPFSALMPEAGDETAKLPAAPEPAVPASAASPTPSVPPAIETAPAAAASATAVVPTPEPGVRGLSPASTERRGAGKADKAEKNDKADKQEPAHAAFRVTAEAGQRAYAAAASEGSTKDSAQRGMSDPRSDAQASSDAAAANTPALPFQVVAERPAPSVGATLAVAGTVTAEVIESAVATELPAQVVQSIRMQAMDGGGEAVVRLNPEYLGELVVAVKVEHGGVSAALQSDVPAVRKWVENNEASLRQALAEHGLQLDRLTVSSEAPQAETGEREGRGEQPREDESQPESRRQRKKAPDATFEVIV